MAKKVIISVISDLVTDQRVCRTAFTFVRAGYNVMLVGRKMKKSLPMDARPYRVKRFILPFEKGPLFYVFYNIRLFFFLLFNKADLLFANDLDTLLANTMASRLKRCRVIYDSHEYFTGVPELQNRPLVQKIWKRLERTLIPQLSYIITVNDSIARLYELEYGKKITVIRNIPDMPEWNEKFDERTFKLQNGLPVDKKIIVLQGSGINIHRGGEEAVDAMQYVENAVLLIIGSGDVIEKLHKMSRNPSLKEKVIFKKKMPFVQMMRYTGCADIGLTLDRDTNINYRFSLPNKLFDYIHAGIAVLATDLVEVKKIVEKYQTGCIIHNATPQHLAEKITFMLSDENRLQQWKENSEKAAKELTWENEQKKLLNILNEV